MPRRLTQQQMTLTDLEWPFHASRTISALAELLVHTMWYVGNIGNSLGLSNKPNKWTNIADVDEPRYVNLDDDAPSDLRVADMYHNRPNISFSDE